jgi:hypothetical protein
MLQPPFCGPLCGVICGLVLAEACVYISILNNFNNLLKKSGDEGDRTPDLGIANAALSHLSYIPTRSRFHIKFAKSGQSKIYSNNSDGTQSDS